MFHILNFCSINKYNGTWKLYNHIGSIFNNILKWPKILLFRTICLKCDVIMTSVMWEKIILRELCIIN